MLIHIESAMKAHQHISYCSIQRDHLKKKKFNTKSEQNIHQEIAHFLKNCTFFLKFLAG